MHILQLLSSESYNFPSTGILHLWLNVFLGIFDAIINKIIFLISLSESSLLVYTNASDFWIFILYPATLSDSFISIVVFWWNLWSSLYTVSCHLQITTVFFLLSYLDGFYIYSSFLTAVSRTSSTVLSKSGESGHPCFVPDLKGNTVIFFPIVYDVG